MLQLPSSTPRFSQAQIAEITRGAKVKVRVRAKDDQMLALLKRADKALDRYYETSSIAFSAKCKIANKNDHVHQPSVYIPDALLNVEWSNGHAFRSVKQINREFRSAIRRAKQRIEDARKGRQAAGSEEWFQRQLDAQMASARRAIHLLREHRSTVLMAFRKEETRLHKVQNAAGLIIARRKHLIAYRSLQVITKLISDKKPKTVQGALATVQYIESRLWCDRPQLFADEGSCPGKFGPLMRAALAVLSHKLNTV